LEYANHKPTCFKARDLLRKTEGEWKNVINLNPKNAEAHYNLGEVLLTQRKFLKAKKEFDKAISLSDHYRTAHYIHKRIGSILYHLRMYKDALNEYLIAKKDAPWNEEIFALLGDVHFKIGNLKESLDNYMKSLRLIFNSYKTLLKSKEIVAKEKRILKTKRKVISKRISENALVISYNGTLRIKNELKNKAYKNYKLFYSSLKRADIANEKGIHFLEAEENHKKAVKKFLKVLKISPFFIYAYFNLGRCYNNMGKYREAVLSWDIYIICNPEDIEAYINKFISLFNMKKYVEAFNVVVQAFKRDSIKTKEIFLNKIKELDLDKKITKDMIEKLNNL